MPISFFSADEAIELLDARQNTSTTWLARCPSCDRAAQLVIAKHADKSVTLHCRADCLDTSVDRAVNAIRNRTRAITATGTVAPSASPSGAGIGDPVPVSVAETATGTVPLTNGMVGIADPTPVSGAQTASGSFPEPPQAAAIADPTSVQLTGEQSGLPSDTVLADTERGYQWLSPLSEAEYAALRESIQSYGVMVPVVVDEDGSVIDGYHRVKVCRELGIDWPSTVLSGLTEAEKWDRARDINDARRHLTASQRKAVLVLLNERLQGESLRVRAGKMGMSKDAVRRMDTKASSGVSNETPELDAYRTGADGKRYRASRSKQATSARPANDIVSASVPDAVVVPPAGQFDADQDSGDSDEVTEIVADGPDIEVPRPAEPRQTLFDTEEPASAEVSAPVGPKRGKAAGTRAGGSATGVPTDPEELAEWLYALLGLAGSKEVVKRLQEVCVRESMRVLPKPGQLTFV
ncbi:MAG: ParB N-terminal domain-containing protein [bacterium]